MEDHGQANLKGFIAPFAIDFDAKFVNLNGPLDILINGSTFTSIPANNQSNFEHYHFDIPGAPNAAVTFLANGDSSNIVITNYTAVPEPASLTLLAFTAFPLLIRRRVV